MTYHLDPIPTKYYTCFADSSTNHSCYKCLECTLCSIRINIVMDIRVKNRKMMQLFLQIDVGHTTYKHDKKNTLEQHVKNYRIDKTTLASSFIPNMNTADTLRNKH